MRPNEESTKPATAMPLNWFVIAMQAGVTGRFSCQPEARAHAREMARNNRGMEFFVVRAVCCAATSDVQFTELA